jgi:hypothetical protein
VPGWFALVKAHNFEPFLAEFAHSYIETGFKAGNTKPLSVSFAVFNLGRLEPKMRIKKSVAVFAAVLIIAASVQAGVVPGRWEKVAAEKPGSNLIVNLITGERLECYFVGLSTDTLTVSTINGAKRELRKADVHRIITADERMGSLTNGIVVGAVIGAIPTGILSAVALAGDCHDCGGAAVGAVALGAGIGAAIGLAVDAAKHGQITLYEAPPKAGN